MKKKIYLLLFVAVALSSCYWYGYEPSYRDGGIVPYGDYANVVCDEYANRYNIADGKSVILTDLGTLAWTDGRTDRYLKLCWADLVMQIDGYYLNVYRFYSGGGMYVYRCYDIRRSVSESFNVLTIPPGASYFVHRVVYVGISGSSVYVRISGTGHEQSESYQM